VLESSFPSTFKKFFFQSWGYGQLFNVYRKWIKIKLYHIYWQAAFLSLSTWVSLHMCSHVHRHTHTHTHTHTAAGPLSCPIISQKSDSNVCCFVGSRWAWQWIGYLHQREAERRNQIREPLELNSQQAQDGGLARLQVLFIQPRRRAPTSCC
jgi:hypothetical protein